MERKEKKIKKKRKKKKEEEESPEHECFLALRFRVTAQAFSSSFLIDYLDYSRQLNGRCQLPLWIFVRSKNGQTKLQLVTVIKCSLQFVCFVFCFLFFWRGGVLSFQSSESQSVWLWEQCVFLGH